MSSTNFSYAFDAPSYAIYANVSQRPSEAPRIAKRFSGTSAHKNALTPKTDPLSRLQIPMDNILSFRIYKIMLQDSLHLLRIMRCIVHRNDNKRSHKMSVDIKEQLSHIVDDQRNSMWVMIEALPNRQYKTQVSQDLDLLELSRRIEAYLSTKKALRKASCI